MSLFGKTCGVRIYGPRAQYHCCEHGCEDCRVGCFNPAAYKNPFLGKKFGDFDPEAYWWRSWCIWSPEYLCTDCYERMVEHAKWDEEFYRDNDKNYVEDPEFTRVLESL